MNQTSPEPRPDGERMRPALLFAAVAASAVLLLVLRSLTAFVVDDAFISFRFARNWAEWGVPAFNSFELAPDGQPVEGFSNLLWTALLALLHGAGADLPSVVGADGHLVVQHVVVDGEAAIAVGDAAGGEAAHVRVKGDVPPVV